jgi:hypothetical protein
MRSCAAFRLTDVRAANADEANAVAGPAFPITSCTFLAGRPVHSEIKGWSQSGTGEDLLRISAFSSG